jgi:coenzyme F420-0:L-glutamate ligase/coenzyme F420-1:gamma-L-glutamate ligase
MKKHDTHQGSVTVKAISGIPDVKKGDNLGLIIGEALDNQFIKLEENDVICVAHKIFSKAEGNIVSLGEISPSREALEIGSQLNKDPRKVEVILRESIKVIRSFKRENQSEGTMICQHKLGFICANSGVDQSNIEERDAVITIPKDPDKSADELRSFLSKKFNLDKLGVIMTDTFGRPWRIGQLNVTVGLSGVPATKKNQGTLDAWGKDLFVTEPAFCDEISAASGLLMQKSAKTPVILFNGLDWDYEISSAKDILRKGSEDMFR